MKIGIIREGKNPPDARVPLTPEQCARIQQLFPLEIVVQPSAVRCYRDEEYRRAGIVLSEYLDDCDLLMGVKEVPVDQLHADKTYCFFSHTIKKQAYNRKLLQAILDKHIRMIDYEVMTDDNGVRLVAFGYFAGMVGAYNGLMTYGQRTGTFQLRRLKDCHDYAEALEQIPTLKLPVIKIALTGTGRVSTGAARVLRDMGIREVKPEEYLQQTYNEAVFTQLDSPHYVARKGGGQYDRSEFHAHPDRYESAFVPYASLTDIFINGIYWDNRAPIFFTLEEMQSPDFRIRVIADITCDICPLSSVPSTIRASTIANPIFGYDPFTGEETTPHQPQVIDMMAIDNLPSELPRDASAAFGEMLITHLIPALLERDNAMVKRATIAENGILQPDFAYLEDYVYIK